MPMKRLILACAVILGCTPGCWAAAPAPLATMHAVASLTNAQASAQLPVAFEATVIYFNRENKVLNVQEGNEAIFVRSERDARLVPDDRVLINGTVQPSFLPYAVSNNITLLPPGMLPNAAPATYDDLAGKKFKCSLVRVHGVIGAADLLPRPTFP